VFTKRSACDLQVGRSGKVCYDLCGYAEIGCQYEDIIDISKEIWGILQLGEF
jgi:hypothetical protein